MVTLAYADSGPNKLHLLFSAFSAPSWRPLRSKAFTAEIAKELAEIAKQTFGLKVRLQELLLWTKMINNSRIFVMSIL
jgi:hypothetical protein